MDSAAAPTKRPRQKLRKVSTQERLFAPILVRLRSFGYDPMARDTRAGMAWSSPPRALTEGGRPRHFVPPPEAPLCSQGLATSTLPLSGQGGKKEGGSWLTEPPTLFGGGAQRVGPGGPGEGRAPGTGEGMPPGAPQGLPPCSPRPPPPPLLATPL